MSRGSFGRTVARAAASGGSKSYRARPPTAWYLVMVVICIAGISLIVYSRNERVHPVTITTAPTASDHWYAAYAVDICGTVQADLPENSNLSKVGIRTFGDGIIDINPGAVSNKSAFTGTNATLGNFASNYPGLTLTATSIKLPGAKQKTWSNGDSCPSAKGSAPGKGQLQVEVWSSPTAKGSLYTGDPTALRLRNGQMVTVAFVPVGATIPVPASRSTLLQDVGSAGTSSTAAGSSSTSSSSSSSSTTATTSGSSTTTT